MATILRQTTVVRDGMHNAFTDLIFWQGCYWVGYRKGADHVSLDGEACLSVSDDRYRFREVAHVRTLGDNRDPKLIPMHDGRLGMCFPSWLGGHTQRNLQQYMAFSEDGFNWTIPRAVYQPHWWLWRIVPHNNRYYAAAYTYLTRTKPSLHRTDFLVSDDLLQWEVLSTLEGVVGGESGFHFFDDGTVWMVSRNSQTDGPAFFSRSSPPYSSWETRPLDTTIHAPVILAHNEKLFVSGRRLVARDELGFALHPTGQIPGAYVGSLGIWELEEGRVRPVIHLPALGDCSYPGLIKDPDGRICLTYYSEHAYHMGVVNERYLPKSSDTAYGRRIHQNDVYFAELEL